MQRQRRSVKMRLLILWFLWSPLIWPLWRCLNIQECFTLSLLSFFDYVSVFCSLYFVADCCASLAMGKWGFTFNPEKLSHPWRVKDHQVALSPLLLVSLMLLLPHLDTSSDFPLSSFGDPFGPVPLLPPGSLLPLPAHSLLVLGLAREFPFLVNCLLICCCFIPCSFLFFWFFPTLSYTSQWCGAFHWEAYCTNFSWWVCPSLWFLAWFLVYFISLVIDENCQGAALVLFFS